MPPTITLKLYRGDDAVHLLTLTQNGTPYDTSTIDRLDLHGVVEGSFGGKSKPKTVINLSSDDGIQIIGKGRILLKFPHRLTKDVTWQHANFDLQATLKDGRIKTLVQGIIALTHDKTRS